MSSAKGPTASRFRLRWVRPALAFLLLGHLAWLVDALAREEKDDSKPLVLTIEPGDRVLMGGESFSLRAPRALAEQVKKAQGSRIRAELKKSEQGLVPIRVAVDGEATCGQVQALLKCLEQAGIPQPYLLPPDAHGQALRVGFEGKGDPSAIPDEPVLPALVRVHVRAVEKGERKGRIHSLRLTTDTGRQEATPDRLLASLQKLRKQLRIDGVDLDADPGLKWSEMTTLLEVCQKAGFRTVRMPAPSQENIRDLINTDIGIEDEPKIKYDVDRIEDVSVPGPVEGASPPTVPPPPGVGAESRVGDGETSPFGRRGGSAAARLKGAVVRGGNARSEQAVADGLKWLALHQANDGHWSLHQLHHNAREKPLPEGKTIQCNCQPHTAHRNDLAATAFGLLPFLGAGITHRPRREKEQPDYTKTVDAGLKYLIRQQTDKGYFGGDMYAHGLATIAMCEAYGMTADPILKRSAQRAVEYICYAQDPEGGGWRYTAREPGDTSVTGWQFMALKSGQMAGLTVPKLVLQKASRFLDSTESKDKGKFAYLPGNEGTPTMTAVGLLCRMYGGINPRNPALVNGLNYLKMQGPPGATNNMYYLYYATQVMHHMGGDYWEFWNLGPNKDGKKGIRDSLIERQDRGATPGHDHQRGSWEGPDQGGRLMTTSLSLLCLEVYYRHLPLYRRDVGGAKKE